MKHLVNTVREIEAGVRFSFSFLWKNERLIYFYMILSTLLTVCNSFVLILFPKYLLDSLVDRQFGTVSVVVGAFCVIQLLCTVFEEGIAKKKEICVGRIRILQKTLLIDKLAALRYEQLEDPEQLRKYEFAQKCVEKGSIENYVQSLHSIASAVFIISGVIYILRDMPLWILLLIIAVVAVNAAGNIASARYVYREITEETPVERQLYYTRGRLMNKEYGKEIRAFQMSDFIVQKTKHAIEGFFSICQNYNIKNNRIFGWVYLVSGVQTFLFYAYNVLLFFRKSITVGTFTMNVSALFQFSSSLNSVFSELIAIAEQSVYLKDYRTFLFAPSTYEGSGEVVKKEEYAIEFVDVSFRYPGQETYALSNVNVKIQPGEKISIVGMNGAGKSTFVKLLMGLYRPTSGSILLNGVNIEQLDPSQYLQLFSAVLQDYQLYSFRIMDNLLFEEEPSEEQCERAGECILRIGLDSAMEKLPDGMRTYLTQRYSWDGVELSGGEHQKLAIARALYRDAPFMVLDEPTSALSPQSEYDIYKRFSQLTENKTVFYISHRLSSCTLCDRILVFRDGRVVEEGPHAKLLKKQGLYAQMFEKQASFYQNESREEEGGNGNEVFE